MKKIILSIAIVTVFSLTAFAQYGSSGAVDSRAMGLAKTYNASSKGVFSLGINPSNLMLSKDGYIEFSTVLPFPYVSAKGGTDFMSLKDFNYYFGGDDNGNARLLTDQDKKNLYDLFKDGGEVSLSAAVSLLSIMYKQDAEIGAFGFSITDVMAGNLILPQSLVDLALNGNELNKRYSFNESDGKAWWIRDYALSYAREIPELKLGVFDQVNAGVSLKLVQGFSYIGVNKMNTYVETGSGNEITGKADMVLRAAISNDFGVDYDFDSTDNNRSDNVGPFPEAAGSGFGVDIGFSAVMDQVWRFSLAVTDIGSISWDKNPVEYTATGDITLSDITEKGQIDSLEDKFSGTGRYVDAFSTTLPTTLRMGASYYIADADDGVPGTLLLALDYNQGFNDSPGNSKNPRVSIGADWTPLDWLSTRTGFSFGGIDGFNWALGLGFNIADLLELNIATSDMNSAFGSANAKRISVAIGSRWMLD